MSGIWRRTVSRPTGLPEQLPPGETLLWQGSPDWRTLLRHGFHARAVALYFGVILAWCLITATRSGLAPSAVAHGMAIKIGLALVPLGLMALYAWGIQRSTTYSITDRRVVMSIGIALPISFNLPYSMVQSAGLIARADGSGDITLQLMPGHGLAYFAFWPHARPWRMASVEPMLRAIPQAATVAGILGQALADHAGGCAPASKARRRVRLGAPAALLGSGPRGQVVAAE
jgi:hypothetical protein